MPHSDPDLKDWSLEFYQKIKPETVVDVGAGCGTYAKLMRDHHKAHWTAIEAWGPYVTQFGLADLYDSVIVADVRVVIPEVFDADLVILGDVVEHLHRKEAIQLIEEIKCYAKHIIVSIPIGDWPQDDVGGVWFERHLATWGVEGIEALLPGCEIRRQGALGVFHWSRA